TALGGRGPALLRSVKSARERRSALGPMYSAREQASSQPGPASPSRTGETTSQRYLVDRKDSEHHSDDDEGHQHPHGEDDDWLQQSEHPLELVVDVDLERVGDLEEHLLEAARLLADPHHVDRERRELPLRLHARR